MWEKLRNGKCTKFVVYIVKQLQIDRQTDRQTSLKMTE